MFALAATNLLGALLFGSIYATAAVRYLTQGWFLVSLVLLFALVTMLWLRVERRHGAGLEPLSRLVRIAIGLVLVLVGGPALILGPLFSLETLLPPEAGVSAIAGPVMVLVLISLFLTVLVNLTGSGILVASAVLGRARTRQSPAAVPPE